MEMESADKARGQGAEDAEEGVIARAAGLVSALRSRTIETDAIAKLPGDTLRELNEARLFELMTPHRYGGLQTTIRTYKEAVAHLGRGDASTAWTVALINIGNWLAATLYPNQVVEKMFATHGGLRASSVLSSRKAIVHKVRGGYVIEQGIWHFDSGVYHANWNLLGIPMVDDAGKVVDDGLAAIPIEQVQILDDWDTIGLRGSGSSSVAVRDVFIPAECVASISDAIKGCYGPSHLRDEPLYRVAFIPFLAIVLVFPALGLGRAALEVFLEALPSRGIKYTWYEKQAEAAVTHLQVSEASAKIDAAEMIVERAVNDLDRNAEEGREYMDILRRARIRRDTGFSSQLIYEAVDLLASASGGSFANALNPINRLWRDARVTNLHGAVCTTTNLELYGRLLCGQSPNTRLI
jgi:3-hydroxy-9,10-secoandrosta-1,3,5(10)-triene-9,17-dione monooxygenase